MENNFTLPPIQPHTEAKHDILTHHMGAWFPILGRFSYRLQYIDGFSGPGEYEGREVGSPILALNVVANHWFLNGFLEAGKQFDFLFVDKDIRCIEHLISKVSQSHWPNGLNIEIKQGEFEHIFREMLDQVETEKRSMPPTLLFIDPFGSAGFPMDLLARLVKYQRIDILINFNYIDLNRWLLPDPTKHITLDRLYGSSRWKPAMQMIDDQRKNFLIREYGNALQEVGWRGTNFEMINSQNQAQYYLIFGTRSSRGMEVIKRAMRSVSPDGLFQYSDRTNPAQRRFIGMGMEEEYARELASHLIHKYRGSEVSKETIQADDVAWHPRWIENDLTAALRQMENSNPPLITKVRNLDGRTRRRNSYPEGCLITFAESIQGSLL